MEYISKKTIKREQEKSTNLQKLADLMRVYSESKSFSEFKIKRNLIECNSVGKYFGLDVFKAVYWMKYLQVNNTRLFNLILNCLDVITSTGLNVFLSCVVFMICFSAHYFSSSNPNFTSFDYRVLLGLQSVIISVVIGTCFFLFNYFFAQIINLIFSVKYFLSRIRTNNDEYLTIHKDHISLYLKEQSWVEKLI